MSTAVVDVDDVRTWPANIQTEAHRIARRLHGTTEYLSDLGVTFEEDDRFRELLRGHKLRAYHATRLLPHEVASIRDRGLLRLTKELVSDRLAAARTHGCISDDEYEVLQGSNAFSQRDWYENRQTKSA